MWQAVFCGYAAVKKRDENPLLSKVYVQCKRQIIKKIHTE